MAASAGRFSKLFGPYPAADSPNLNAGRREWRNTSNLVQCSKCGRNSIATIFVYAPGTSQLPSVTLAVCDTCWSNNPANTPLGEIKDRTPCAATSVGTTNKPQRNVVLLIVLLLFGGSLIALAVSILLT